MVTTNDGRSFVAAEFTSLIEGALKCGLGTQFLRHIERTRVILHVIDMVGWKAAILMRTMWQLIRNWDPIIYVC